MTTRTLGQIAVVVILLLIVAICYPGALTKPYSGGEVKTYAVAHESSAAFDETVAAEGLETSGDTMSVDDLSADERRAFSRATEQPPREDPGGTDGWRSLGVPTVCDPALVFCDEYAAMPNPSDSTYTLVEDADSTLYLVRVDSLMGPTWSGIDLIVEFGIKLVVLGPYALFLLYQTWPTTTARPTRLSVGYGATLCGGVLAYPYLLMAGLPAASWHYAALAVLTGAVMLAEIGRGRGWL